MIIEESVIVTRLSAGKMTDVEYRGAAPANPRTAHLLASGNAESTLRSYAM